MDIQRFLKAHVIVMSTCRFFGSTSPRGRFNDWCCILEKLYSNLHLRYSSFFIDKHELPSSTGADFSRYFSLNLQGFEVWKLKQFPQQYGYCMVQIFLGPLELGPSMSVCCFLMKAHLGCLSSNLITWKWGADFCVGTPLGATWKRGLRLRAWQNSNKNEGTWLFWQGLCQWWTVRKGKSAWHFR